MLRQYISLIQSSPITLYFQHNSLMANELMAIRRELNSALRKIDDAEQSLIGRHTKITVVQTGILETAMKIIESGFPGKRLAPGGVHGTQQPGLSEAGLGESSEHAYTHNLSEAARSYAKAVRLEDMRLSLILSGPIMLVTLPSASPMHLKCVLSLLSPSVEFPAPKKRTNPTYHDPFVQAGVHKLILLAASVESRVIDVDGVKRVGSIPGGIQGLRAQLIHLLQSVPTAVTNLLESAGRSVYMTMEGRKEQLQEKSDGSTQQPQ